MKSMSFGTAALLAMSTGVAGADPAAIPPASSFDWTGAYVGIQAGHAWGSSTYDIAVNEAFFQYDPQGWFGGIFVGYTHQFDNGLTIGVEGEINVADIESGRTYISNWPTVAPNEFADSKIKWQGSLRGRFGYGFGRLLPYVTGGIAFAGYDHSVTWLPETQPFGDAYLGWTVGAGLEYALTDNLTGRAEYRYADYGDRTYPFTAPFYEHTVDLSSQDVRFGIAYKF